MKAKIEKRPDYKKGYPYIVLVSKDSWGWYIDSWFRTKREAVAQVADIESLVEEGNN